MIALLDRAKQINPELAENISEDLFGSAISGLREGTPGEPFPRDIQMKADAEAVLVTLSRVSPAYALYEWIKEHAEAGIVRAHRDREAYEE